MADLPANASIIEDVLLDSTLESVDVAEVGIAVRETMVNAVAHGNHYSSRKKVHLRVMKNDKGIVVEIDDEGKGFELEEVPDPRHGENILRQSGRGLLMIRAFMDELEIKRREPQGTHVRMVKHFQQKST
jgi:serine/threonine-protein kinase RsbW